MEASAVFTRDRYTTPAGREKLLHRLLLRGRLYYILRFVYVVFHYWPVARSGGLDQQAWCRAAFDIFRAIEDCGGRFDITGLDNLKAADGPVVFVANHMSTLETLVPPAFIYPRKKPVYVIKEQLLTVPFFGAYVQECIGVTRKSPSEDFRQVMTRGAEKIGNGYSVIVFPQATRSPCFDPEKFNSLGVKLAKRCRVPVIPIALKTDFWGTGALIKDFGPLHPGRTIHFEFGSPLEIHGSGKEEHEQIMAFIRSRLDDWQRER
jgi:1-acyl-sn-glycerol-3-phosphate acyltransferase